MERIICLMIGYGCGLLQTGYIYGKSQGIDIRDHGSGNAGTTNTLRVLGKKAAAITFLGDALKCVVAAILVWVIFGKSHPDNLLLYQMYAGFGAVMGHNYPFYLKFKGGKGIATTGGMIFITDWKLAVMAALIFGVIVFFTRYVSVGSLVISVFFFISVLIEGRMGLLGMSEGNLMEVYVIVFLFMISAFYKHRANIDRLRRGCENKIGQKKSS